MYTLFEGEGGREAGNVYLKERERGREAGHVHSI